MTVPPGYTEVAPGLFRGARPTLAVLKAFDPPLKTIITLEMNISDVEFQASFELGFVIKHVPMSEVFPPSYDTLRKVALMLDDATLRPCGLHCFAGDDRTGASVAMWRVMNGWTPKAAFKEMIAMGFHKRYLYWKPFIWLALKRAAKA